MVKIIQVLILSACIMFSLTSCAEPETAEPEHAFISAESENVSNVNALQEDQGRFVRFTVETPEDVYKNLEIQATVTVPETTVVEGEFEHSVPPVELIEEMLTGGEKMEPDQSDIWNERWRIEADEGSEYAFKMIYSINSNERMGHFQNTSVKDLANYPYTEQTCPDEEMAEKLQELTDQANAIYKKAGMQVRLGYREIGIDGNRYFANIEMISLIDNIPLVEENYKYISSGCFLGEDGVSSMAFAGSFIPENTKEVSIISVDELLEIVKEKAEAGELIPSEPVTSIELAYYVQFDPNVFYPVWCLSGNLAEFCIDAQTGEIVN